MNILKFIEYLLFIIYFFFKSVKNFLDSRESFQEDIFIRERYTEIINFRNRRFILYTNVSERQRNCC